MAEPDLFVVCKNCSAQVSPYVTECPYCGQRVRKRAPKIGPDGEPRDRRLRRRAAKLPKLRPGEIPGIAPETAPYATWTLIGLALAALVAGQIWSYADVGGLVFPVDGEWWRLVTTPFVHANFGYAFIALTATGIFGMHLERRFGRLAPVAIFVASGAAGAALSAAADVYPAVGANGAALGLLCAWLVDDRRAAARGQDRGNDLLGVHVVAALLIALSLATEDASLVAAAGGAVTGSVAGLLLSGLKKR
jgi:membrane associated rhomboid family serine protease